MTAFKGLAKPELRDGSPRSFEVGPGAENPGIGKKNGKAQDKPKADQGAMLRFWMGEAVYYNKRNGRGENELPPFCEG